MFLFEEDEEKLKVVKNNMLFHFISTHKYSRKMSEIKLKYFILHRFTSKVISVYLNTFFALLLWTTEAFKDHE